MASMNHSDHDHYAHHGAEMSSTMSPPALMDHAAHQMDHGAMDHSKMDSTHTDHGATDHGSKDHGNMDMDHGTMDHGMDHNTHLAASSSLQADHGSTSGNHSEHGMAMFFHGGVTEVILFSCWRINTVAGLATSCLGLFLIAVLYEGLKVGREVLQRRATACPCGPPGDQLVPRHAATLPHPHSEGEAVGVRPSAARTGRGRGRVGPTAASASSSLRAPSPECITTFLSISPCSLGRHVLFIRLARRLSEPVYE